MLFQSINYGLLSIYTQKSSQYYIDCFLNFKNLCMELKLLAPPPFFLDITAFPIV